MQKWQFKAFRKDRKALSVQRDRSLLSGCFFDFDHRTAFALDAFGVLFSLLLVLDEGPKHPDFVVLMLLEVEAVLLSEEHLQQIVIQAFLRDTHFAGGVLKRVAH